MQSNQNNIYKFQNVVSKNEQNTNKKAKERLNYLYPNGHRITHQMRWYKVSRDRDFRSDSAA